METTSRLTDTFITIVIRGVDSNARPLYIGYGIQFAAHQQRVRVAELYSMFGNTVTFHCLPIVPAELKEYSGNTFKIGQVLHIFALNPPPHAFFELDAPLGFWESLYCYQTFQSFHTLARSE